MILDTLEHAGRYAGIHPGIDRAMKEIQNYSAENFTAGRVDVDGEDLFLMFASYDTHLSSDAQLEAHRSYIDVMVMVEGEETIFVKSTDCLQNITKEYDPSIDALLADLDADTTAVRLKAGSFAVLFPQDSHAPGCCVDHPASVKKIIGKVKI